MGYCTATSISNFIAEITSRYLYVFIILSMKQIQQALIAPMNDTDPYIVHLLFMAYVAFS